MSQATLITRAYDSPQTESRGYCRSCKTTHSLGSRKAIEHCLTLIEQLETQNTINLFGAAPDDQLKTKYLLGPARGKMFGVMHCMQPDGATLLLRAFSGQYNGRWEVRGWVPPLFDIDDFSRINYGVEKQIKTITIEIEQSLPHSDKWLLLREKRRKLSQELMRDIHSLYRLTNFRGETTTLYQSYTGPHGIPTGTGDCCAPKLLNHAAKNNLTPLALAEFYWGRKNRSASRQHGSFYSSCKEKCGPILGFMLCGLDHHDNKYTAT